MEYKVGDKLMAFMQIKSPLNNEVSITMGRIYSVVAVNKDGVFFKGDTGSYTFVKNDDLELAFMLESDCDFKVGEVVETIENIGGVKKGEDCKVAEVNFAINSIIVNISYAINVNTTITRFHKKFKRKEKNKLEFIFDANPEWKLGGVDAKNTLVKDEVGAMPSEISQNEILIQTIEGIEANNQKLIDLSYLVLGKGKSKLVPLKKRVYAFSPVMVRDYDTEDWEIADLLACCPSGINPFSVIQNNEFVTYKQCKFI